MEKTIFNKTVLSPVGNLVLSGNENALVSISFGDNSLKDSGFFPEELKKAEIQLAEYFEGTRFVFDLNLDPEGTAFQKKVWDLVKAVPFGETTSYLAIARQLGSTTFTRAVGLANSKNPIPIIIPCHRIIGAKGALTGYAGGLGRKKWLLLHEQSFYKTQKSLF